MNKTVILSFWSYNPGSKELKIICEEVGKKVYIYLNGYYDLMLQNPALDDLSTIIVRNVMASLANGPFTIYSESGKWHLPPVKKQLLTA